MEYTKVEGSSNLLGEFTDKAVTSEKALAKFARKKTTPKRKPAKPRKTA